MHKDNIILDSGAYSAFTKGTPIELEQYIQFIKDHPNNFSNGYFNLDVIGDGKASYKNWIEMRRCGLDPIPVYHLGTDEKWLERYKKQTDFLSLGAIANLDTQQRLLGLSRIWKKHLQDDEANPIRKVHGLGLNALKIITMFPWYSVDSSAAIKAAAFGKVYVPKITNVSNEMIIDYKETNLISVSDQATHLQRMNSLDSLYNMSPMIKSMYSKYFKDCGVSIGSIENVIRRPKRKDKNKEKYKGPKLFTNIEVPVNKDIEPTLTNNWNMRFEYNVLFWKKLITIYNQQRKHPIILFFVVSANKHYVMIKKLEVPLLISYFLLKSKGSLYNVIVKGELNESK